MTDQEHTPEPWYVIPNPEWPGARSRVARSPDEPWANFAEICYPGNANAHRIVACVNALQGIRNPAGIRGLVEAAWAALEAWNTGDGRNVAMGYLGDAIAALDAEESR